MTEPLPSGVFAYKLGFVASIVLLWTIACVSAGFVIGTIFGRPAMKIENYNADGFISNAQDPLASVVPDVKVSHRSHQQ